jgi:hypothetical protein
MKKKYSTLLNFALAACVATTLVACSGDDGDSTKVGLSNGTNQRDPQISIGGTVLDTNGNALSGITVSCQAKETTTNSSGQWIIDKLRVTNVAGSDDDTAQSDNAVRCVVQRTANYLGAIVSVMPEAQISGDATADTESDAPYFVTFIDGMYAEAGTAWLPMLGTTVKGRIEDCTTEQSVVGATVKLDMLGVDNNQIETQAGSACQYGCAVDYSTAMYQAVTGADGSFTIANVPDDSILRIYVEDYQNINLDTEFEAYAEDIRGDKPETDSFGISEYITTINEGQVYLGDVCVSPIMVGDLTRPCVANIEGWIYPTSYFEGTYEVNTPYFWNDELEFALLEDDIDGTDGIDIIFNESMNPTKVDENSVVVWDDWAEDYITDFTTSLSGNVLTLTTAEPIPADHHILVYLLRDDFQDLAGNYLHAYNIQDFNNRTPEQTKNNVCEDVFFAKEFYSLNYTAYVVVGFKIHSPDDTDVDAATGLVQECTDYSKTVSGQTDLMGEYPTVFRSEIASTNDFYNLNADDDYEHRLEALADVLGCPEDDTSLADIHNNYASVSFVAPTSGGWEISGDGDCDDNCDGNGDGSFETSVIADVDPGDEVCVDSYDDFDNLSAQVCITVGDCVAPTTVLNYAYNTCGHLGLSYSSWETNETYWHAAGPGDGGPGYDTDYAAHICVDFEAGSLPEFGDGGENTNEGTPGVCGIPTLNITCRLLKDPALAAEGAVSEPIQFYGLYTGGADGQIPAPGAYGPFPDFALYDATEFAAWVPFADTIGVAFSESIAMTDGGSIDWSGVTDITSWSIGNNISNTDDGDTPDGGPDSDDSSTTDTPPSVDLVQLTVDDVLTLANEDHQEVMDFSGAVEDLAGNPADNARVVINDLMPPFVEYAYWDGGLTIKFNESVAPCIDGVSSLPATMVDCTTVFPDPGNTDSDVIVLWDTNGNGDIISLTGATLGDVDGGTDNLLTIPAGNLSSITGDENFPATTDTTYALVYDEDIYDDLGFTGPYQHGAMSWGAIPDARGNMWADYDSAAHGTVLYRDVDGGELCNMPTFAVADVLGPFTVTGIGVTNFTNTAPALCSNGPGSTGTMPSAVNHVMSYSMSHPVNLQAQYWEGVSYGGQDVSDSINCTAASGTQLCTLAEVNAGMTNGAWVDQNVRVCTDLDCATNDFVGDVSYLTGVSATLAPDRMSMTITVQNNTNPCYNWQTNDYMLPVWNVWSAFNVGTFKQLNLQGVP